MSIDTREWRGLLEVLEKHEKQCNQTGRGRLDQRVQAMLDCYQSTTVGALEQSKRFRDRLLTDLRAWVLVLTMVANAYTHREKDSRLRGCVELINTCHDTLEKLTFELGPWFPFWDPWKADYPSRYFQDRIRELEAKVADYEKAKKPGDGDVIS
jgi:hypothetical protein